MIVKIKHGECRSSLANKMKFCFSDRIEVQNILASVMLNFKFWIGISW